MRDRNVLARRERPTTKSYRAAVKQIVLDLQSEFGLNDQELADRLGCSRGTIKNARAEAADLNGVTLANIEYEFGPAALDPFLALGGSRAVPTLSAAGAEGRASLHLSGVLHALIEAQHPDSDGGATITRAELVPILHELRDARTALDALIEITEAPAVRPASRPRTATAA